MEIFRGIKDSEPRALIFVYVFLHPSVFKKYRILSQINYKIEVQKSIPDFINMNHFSPN